MIANGNSGLGSIIPLLFNSDPIAGYQLKDLDFTLEVFSPPSSKRQIIKKKETYPIDNGSVVYYVDSRKIGAGKYYTKATINIPDPKAPEGYWIEVRTVESGITIDPQ